MSFFGDAYSLGYHWVYDTKVIQNKFRQFDEFSTPGIVSYHKGKSKGDLTHYGDQGIFLLESIIREKGFNKEKFARFWAEKMTGYSGYKDHASKQTLENMEKSKDYLKSGSDSEDLGGFSTIAPLIYYNLMVSSDEENFIADIVDQTIITHPKDIVLSGARFIGHLVFSVYNGMNLKEATNRARKLENSPFMQTIFNALKETEGDDPVEAIVKLGQSCHIKGALSSIVYILERYGENSREGLKINVLAGGDSAARGMVLGLIFGLYGGDSGFSRSLINQMNCTGKILQYTDFIKSLNK